MSVLLVTMALALNCGMDISEQVILRVQARYGSAAAQRTRQWHDLITRHVGADENLKIHLVNDFFNRIPPKSDRALWHAQDYWATPIEALGMNGADCEDYSLAKYFTLRQMGVAESRLHITYVKAIELNEAHMVLAYYPSEDAPPLILDNLEPEIRPATERTDLKPVYSFNGAGLWTSVNRARGKRVGQPTQINLWNDFLERLKQDLGTT